jgi:hypothetical protein
MGACERDDSASGRYFFFGRDSIGMTRLSVFFSRRSLFTFMRRFFDAFVRGLPFIVGSFNFRSGMQRIGCAVRALNESQSFFYKYRSVQQGELLAVGANSP